MLELCGKHPECWFTLGSRDVRKRPFGATVLHWDPAKPAETVAAVAARCAWPEEAAQPSPRQTQAVRPRQFQS